jgi:hypothetical protein
MMKYTEMSDEKKKSFNSFLRNQATQQSQKGRDIFENVSKSVLLANTGGVAVLSSLIASGIDGDAGGFLRLSIIFFVAGVSLFLVFRFLLSIKIGNSVADIKGFHQEALGDNEDVSDAAVRAKLSELSSSIEGSKPMWAIGASITLFLVGAIIGCIGIFYAIG